MNYGAFASLAIFLIMIMCYMGLLNFRVVKNIDKASNNTEKEYNYKIRIKLFMIEYENTIYYTTNCENKKRR